MVKFRKEALMRKNKVEENKEAKSEEICEETEKLEKDFAKEHEKAEADAEKTKEEKAEPKEPQEDENGKYMRLLADFQNYKKRIEKEKSDIYSFANEKLISELLAIVDNFERALESECQDEKYAEGMANIFKMMYGILEKNGLTEIEALGSDFDPNFHAAVATEDSEEHESGKVSAVLQKGYKLNSKVIRPAMVKVAN